MASRLARLGFVCSCLAALSCGGGGSSGDAMSRDTGMVDCNTFFTDARGNYAATVIDVRGVGTDYFVMDSIYNVEIENPLVTVRDTILGDLEHDFSAGDFISCTEGRGTGIYQATWAGAGRENRQLTIMFFAEEETFTMFTIGFPDDDGRAAFRLQ